MASELILHGGATIELEQSAQKGETGLNESPIFKNPFNFMIPPKDLQSQLMIRSSSVGFRFLHYGRLSKSVSSRETSMKSYNMHHGQNSSGVVRSLEKDVVGVVIEQLNCLTFFSPSSSSFFGAFVFWRILDNCLYHSDLKHVTGGDYELKYKKGRCSAFSQAFGRVLYVPSHYF